MASNLALVSQCAALGVPRVYPRSQVRTNIVTKSNHMTAKPLVRCESAGFPMFGNPIQSDSVTKRGDQIKMMVASSTPSVGNDVQITCTNVNLSNDTFVDLEFTVKNDRSGDGNPPQLFVARTQETYVHNADPQTHESVGGVAYTITGDLKWIVAWSCLRDAHPKVYTEFTVSSQIDWEDIFKKKMPKFNPQHPIFRDSYKGRVYIETSNPEKPGVYGILKEVEF